MNRMRAVDDSCLHRFQNCFSKYLSKTNFIPLMLWTSKASAVGHLLKLVKYAH